MAEEEDIPAEPADEEVASTVEEDMKRLQQVK